MYQGFLGIIVICFISWLISEDRLRVKLSFLSAGLFTQFLLIFLILKIPIVRYPFEKLTEVVNILKDSLMHGTGFVYGYLGGSHLPFEVKEGANTFIFFFQALPMVLLVGALSMLLFYWRVLPMIVKGFSRLLQKIFHIGGALGVCASANVFFGPAESSLLIRPYLKDFSRSELLTIMTCGLATTSASVMPLYSTILEPIVPNALGHILSAAIVSLPASITISRILIPETKSYTSGDLIEPYRFSNWMDAIFQGTSDGMKVLTGIASMLVVVIALVSLVNAFLGNFPLIGGEPLTLERILGFIMSPIAWLMGISWDQAPTAGYLLGTKLVTNEVLAFLTLAKLPGGALSPQATLISTYALSGFANVSSVAMFISTFGSMVPERRNLIMDIALKGLIAGTFANILSATMVGIIMQI